MFLLLSLLTQLDLSHPATVTTPNTCNDDQTCPFTHLIPLKSILELSQTNRQVLSSATTLQVSLQNGQYHTSEFPIESKSLHLCGNVDRMNHIQKAIALPRIQPTLNSNLLRNGKSGRTFLFSVRNSTFALEYLHFIVSEPGDTIAVASESKIRLENSQITSNLVISPISVIPSSFSPTSVHIISCEHLSSDSHHLLPFVQIWGNEADSEADFDIQESMEDFNPDPSLDLSIFGIGLSFVNQDIVLGTGPLFSSTAHGNIVSMESCRMRNTTSLKPESSQTRVSTNQRVVSCAISESTNHLYGTLINDMNEGGSLLCSNSSFVSCQTTLTPIAGPPTFTLQHKTTQTKLAASATTQTFTLCTFLSCSAHLIDGGAILSALVDTSLSVVDSSFLFCSAKGKGGGSVYFRPIKNTNTFSCSGSSFVHGSADGGGALYPYGCYSTMVSACYFHNLTATNVGGAIDTSNHAGSVFISSCVFSTCHANNFGGAYHVNNVKSFTFDSCQFRGNTVPSRMGNDLHVMANHVSHMNSTSFVECDSTSMQPTIFHSSSSTYFETLIPPPTSTNTLESIELVEEDGKTFVKAVTTSAVSGTMLVLMTNEGGYTPPTSSSPPAINRIVSFSFSSSNTASTEVSTGENGLLQAHSTYSVISASMKNVDFTVYPETPTQLPNPPRIVEANCRAGTEWNEAFVKLAGAALEEGSYTVTLKGVSDFSFVVSFVTQETVQNSTEYRLLLSGEGSLFDFNTQYWIESVTGEDGTEMMFDPPTLSFTTPSEPPRFLGVGEITFSDATKKTINIVLTGSQLTTSTFTLTLTPNGGGQTASVPFSSTSATTGTAKAIVYEFENNKVQLIFGETYTITKVTDNDANDVFLAPDLTVIVPPEPTRLCSASLGGDGINDITVKLAGKVFENKKSYTVVLSGTSTEAESSETHKATLTVTGSTSAVEITSVQVLYPSIASNANQLRYGMKYVVTSMTDTIVEPSVHFITPSRPPRIISSVCELGGDNETSVAVTLQGMRLEMGGSFTLNIEQVGEGADTPPATSVLQGTFSGEENEQQHTLLIKIFGESKPALRYGTQWKVTSFSSSLARLVVDDSFRIEVPNEPARIVGASASLSADGNSTEVTLIGRWMEAGEYEITLNDSPVPPFLVWFVGTVTEERESTAKSFVVYGGLTEIELEFGQNYSISSVSRQTSPVEPIWINTASSWFVVPSEPMRIENGSANLTPKRTEASVILSGRFLAQGEFTLVVHNSDKTSTVTMTDPVFEAGKLKFVHQVSLSDAAMLLSGQTYSISSLTMKDPEDNSDKPILVNDDVSILIPGIPIVTSASFSYGNEMKTSGVVTLEGSNLLLDGFYVVTVEPATCFVVSFDNSTTGSSSELEMGTGKTLSFSQQYELLSIRKEDDEEDVIACSGVAFTTKERPRKATLIVDWRGTDESGLCGSETRPCKTFDAAWLIVPAVGIVEPTIALDHGGRMRQGVSIDSSMSVLLKNGGNVPPTLEVWEEADSDGEKGAIVVDGGELEILDVDVSILSHSPSFVFLFASSSTIILKDGSIVGQSSTDPNTPSPANSEDDICSWTSGIVQLSKCTTNITATVLSHLSQGAINMEGGSLSVYASSFSDNSPQIDSFPSIHRNIHCSENGSVEIGSLSGGDGTSARQLSPWMSSSDCSLSSPIIDSHSAFFIPTLNTSSSTSSWNKKNETFTITIEGSTLIPWSVSGSA
ncbi:hypothetical protein BLNAU_16835 [Blattamonas nauphoetae]|uniref:Uncharacterized protein n=1 Tax=Blattamonas nauphoetae TaxID=2049346 RepID=A0ABQ9X7Z1_9EUKA|nr:hypothetical protein BLNAU_16835 [Blattamonas nauphoetae]